MADSSASTHMGNSDVNVTDDDLKWQIIEGKQAWQAHKNNTSKSR